MRVVTIEGKTIASARDVHQVLHDALDFGPYYGWNLNALNDRLRYDVERPFKVVWEDFAVSRKVLGNEVADAFLAVFELATAGDDQRPPDRRLTVEIRQ